MYVDSRKKLVKWLRSQLIGPACKDSLSTSPLSRYPAGVLHPIDPDSSGIDPASSSPEETALRDDVTDDTPANDETNDSKLAQSTKKRRYVPPSSVGFSCFVRGEAQLLITASATSYQHPKASNSPGRGRHRRYEREELQETTHELKVSGSVRKSIPIWQNRAGIDVRSRQHQDGLILTITLCNRSEMKWNVAPNSQIIDRVEKSLFEAHLECIIDQGELLEYPRVDPSLLTDEELELELQYRKKRIYAVGHGAAADWNVPQNDKPKIWSEFMPETEVPLMTVQTSDENDENEVLRLHRLADAPMPDELSRFVDNYGNWIDHQQLVASEFRNPDEQNAANRICERMQTALGRMRQGIELLRTDQLASESFQIANRAMFDQLIRTDIIKQKEIQRDAYRWRPFQLAFLLTVIASVIREDDDFRDILDLIWFPTGGGKTEAYLGLIAFLIAWRRLKYPDRSKGTAAFMRYTLRLLTQQQFQRATRMMCSLDLIRRKDQERLGETPIDIGIWVGGEFSPNRFEDAEDIVAQIKEGKPNARYRLLLERCPWCDTQFDADRGYCATNDTFNFYCTNRDCDFSDDDLPLPCNVVDEALYNEPPTLLIGTVDKFARLAWEERSGAFFGLFDGSRPPELIIQDELHLITGPLGSVAGLYEAGIETLLVQRGLRPKYVASTATIRMAREQVQRLYAKDLAVFPPPGLSYDNTFFARTDKERPGRLYLGFLAPMLDQQHCLAPLAAALLAAPQALFADSNDKEALLDAWWTQVVYHGSLKHVGYSHNALVTNVREFGRRIESELKQLNETDLPAEDDDLPDAQNRFQNTEIAQLTSRQTSDKNAKIFQQLTKSQGDNECLDVVLATNMISVGLDVARLALLVVNGQPLTTAEYIQTTSRVGRADVPGLVVCNYFRNQARSLSHYESFRPYHESFYRFVEPSSITPYTYQVRSRALHAALVIAIRHACTSMNGNNSAGKFNQTIPEIEAIIAKFKRRCVRAANGSRQEIETDSHLDRLVTEWHDKAAHCRQAKRQLNYKVRGNEKGADRLLYAHEETRPGLWATLNSMRNVEGEGALKVQNWKAKKDPDNR